MPETLSTREKLSAISLSVVLSLGISACSSAESTSKQESTPSSERVGDYIYYEDGTRDYTKEYRQYKTFCDGLDLIDQSNFGRQLSRSVNHPACKDGKITPSDFDNKKQ